MWTQVVHLISGYVVAPISLSLIRFKCCFFIPVFKKQQQMACISRQCWLFIFNPFLADFLVLQFTSICASVLTWLTLETTAERGQHVFTCAWTAMKSRMSGAGPAVSQVRVLWQFGSMARYQCFAPKANFGVSFSSCFPPLFHLPSLLMHL